MREHAFCTKGDEFESRGKWLGEGKANSRLQGGLPRMSFKAGKKRCQTKMQRSVDRELKYASNEGSDFG